MAVILTTNTWACYWRVSRVGNCSPRLWQNRRVVACLAVITLIKACKFTHQLVYIGKKFFTLSGPTGSLNTKVLFKEYKLFAYVYQLL